MAIWRLLIRWEDERKRGVFTNRNKRKEVEKGERGSKVVPSKRKTASCRKKKREAKVFS